MGLSISDMKYWLCILTAGLILLQVGLRGAKSYWKTSTEGELVYVGQDKGSFGTRVGSYLTSNNMDTIKDASRALFSQNESLLSKPKHSPTIYEWAQGENMVSHGILTSPMLSPRRNHDCLVRINEADGHPYLWLIGGRFAQNVETIDLVTGAQSFRTNTTEPLLNTNHFNVVTVRSVVDGNTEIWIPCGFEGNQVNKETSMTHMKVIEIGRNNTVVSLRRGPELDRPRGACGAVAMNLDGPGKPEHICVFGGSDGKHDKGIFLDTISCYDRVKKTYIHPFGVLPSPADHENIIHVPPRSCGKESSEMFLFLNFRSQAYGDEKSEIYALNVSRDKDGKVIPGSDWYLYSNDISSRPRDASGFILGPEGRFLFNFGGVRYTRVGPRKRKKGRATDEIRAFDLCKKRWIPNVATLDSRRFALLTCSSNEFTYTCGGDMVYAPGAMHDPERTDFHHEDMHNGRECELHRLAHLEKEAEIKSKELPEPQETETPKA